MVANAGGLLVWVVILGQIAGTAAAQTPPEGEPGQPPFQRPTIPGRPRLPSFQRPTIPGRPGSPPIQRPTFPGRPGFPAGGRWPGMGPPAPAHYRMAVTGEKRVRGVYRSRVWTNLVPATQWEAYFPAATEMERQGAVRSWAVPEARQQVEPSREHRPILRIPLPVGQGAQVVDLAVHYEGTLLARRLVPLKERETPPAVLPLNMGARLAYLTPTATLNYRAESFANWLDAHGLRRRDSEEDVEFARRVFTTMLPLFTYRDGVEVARITDLCRLEVLDCDTLSLLYTGALRASGVPARVVYGWPLRTIEHSSAHPLSGHTQAEFFAEGVGWVPVDLSDGILHRSREPLTYFGQDNGELLIVQIDPDYLLTHPDGSMQRSASIHPGPNVWAHGEQKPDAAIRPVSWEVEVVPTP